MRVILTGHIDVPEDRRHAVAQALPEHIRLTRAEPGCLFFTVEADALVPGRYEVHECFADRSAFDAHQARARASDWGRVSAGLSRDYRVREGGA